ncbi:MAG: hypothetical protein ACYSWS_04310 [Planctomycetota bacterium]
MLKILKRNLITILAICMIVIGGTLYLTPNIKLILKQKRRKSRQFIFVTVPVDAFVPMRRSNPVADVFAGLLLYLRIEKK